MVFRIELLPASNGDCIWIEYGPARDKTRTVLIDGGTANSSDALLDRIKARGEGHVFELIVVTHVDEDHIGGVIEAVARADLNFRCEDFWFNSFDHLLEASGALGGAEGDELTTLLQRAVEAGTLRWNNAFRGNAIYVPSSGNLPTVTLVGGAKITLLSPSPAKAKSMRDKWSEATENGKRRLGVRGIAMLDAANRALGKVPVPVLSARSNLATAAEHQDKGVRDPSEANGSSIAFLFEYDGKTVLFGADAHHGVLCDSLDRLSPDEAVSLDAFKLPHHGSNNNVSTNLINAVNCPLYLVSTDGTTFGHPNEHAIATTIVNGLREDQFETVQIAFNYRSDYTSPWDNDALKAKYKYEVRYAKDGKSLVVDL
jgi:hypothetical protein